MNKSLLLLSCFVSVAHNDELLAQPQEIKTALIASRQQLHQDDLRNNQDGLREAVSEMEGLVKNEAVSALAHYYAGYGQWRLSATLSSRAEQLDQLEKGIRHLEASIKLDEQFADAQALLSSLVGQHPDYRAKPEYRGLLEKALKLEPRNPRVVYADAVSLFFTPEQFGGDRKRAIERWEEAVRLAAAEKASGRLEPEWGKAEIVGWLGGVYLSQNQREKARRAFEKALEVAPDFWWVKTVGLPQAISQDEGDGQNDET